MIKLRILCLMTALSSVHCTAGVVSDAERAELESQTAPYDDELPVDPDEELFDNTDRRLVSESIDGDLVQKSWGQDSDATGSVVIRMYECSGFGQHLTVTCDVDPDEVLVGGGAWADYGTGPGALLTASFPESNDLETWIGKSKDHGSKNAHTLHVYSIGMKLTGVDRAVLKSKMRYVEATSGASAHPTRSLSLPEGFQLIGGGARVNWSGAGNLLFESYPANSTTWKVGSKDHGATSPASITAFAIGISTGAIAGFGTLEMQIRNTATYAPALGVGTATRNPTSGWATTCAGGRAEWEGPRGRLLFEMRPNENDGVQASSKDHGSPDSGMTWAYALEARKKP